MGAWKMGKQPSIVLLKLPRSVVPRLDRSILPEKLPEKLEEHLKLATDRREKPLR